MSFIMNPLNTAFGWLIKVCYGLVNDYAVAILIFALIMKIILFPLGIKQQKNMQKQASLRPKEEAIRKRYAGRTDKATQQKMQQEIMDLYQKENYKVFGGCLPLLIQFPIIIALYNVIRNPLTYLLGWSSEQIEGIRSVIESLGLVENVKTLAEIDMIAHLKNNFSSFAEVIPAGFSADQIPNFKALGLFDLSLAPKADITSWLILIPIITFVTAYLSMKISKKLSYQAPQAAATADTAMSMKIMDLMMPLMSAWIAYAYPGVLGVYWIFQNLLGTLQQFILSRMFKIPKFTEEDFKKAEKEMNGSVKKEKKKKQKSLHNIDEVENGASEPARENAPTLKEDRNGKKPELKDGEKKKVRSLHHIDDED